MPRRITKVEATPLQQWASWAGTEGIIFLILAGLVYLARPEMTWYVKVGLGLGVAGLAFYLAVMGPTLGRALFRRRTLHDLNGAVFVLSLVAIFGLINYVADRRHVQWDLTKSGRYTLSEQTRQILKKLDKKVTVTALYPSNPRQPGGAERPRVEDLLKQYRSINDRITIKFVDPFRTPNIIYEKGLDQGMKTLPLTLFETEGGQREEVAGSQERDFTGALLKLTTKEKKKIYFLQGHGELDPDRLDPRTGISTVKAALVAQQHDVAPLTLTGKKPAVPADAAALVVAGPRLAFRPEEITALGDYLKGGGHVLLMAGPRSPDLSGLLKPWGLTVGAGIVADAALAVESPTTPITTTYEPHEVTESLQRMLCAFPASRPVNVVTPAPAGVITQPLIRTSQNSWVETHPEKGIQYDGQDIRGPVTIAAVATKDLSPTPPAMPGAPPPPGPRKMARLLVVGSADFATDYWTRGARIGNPYLVLNAVNWLAEEDALVSIPPKDDQPETVMLSDSQKRGLAIVNFLLFPGLALLGGIFTWWKRR